MARPLTIILVVLVVVGGLTGIVIYSGVYNIGADAPHTRLVHGLFQQLRESSITRHSKNIPIPADLGDRRRIGVGAGLYQEMCVGCHVAPGVEKTEMSQGLYPPAPDLARVAGRPAAEQFWIIKHGIKSTAMPAWGKTHTDELIWDMVAFLQALPKMNAQQYEAAVASAPESHEGMVKDMHGEHETASEPHTHAHAETHTH